MAFVVRRLVRSLPAVAAVLVITFALIHFAPGDAVDALAGAGGDEATYSRLREYLQLDQPMWRQFLSYVANLAQGDLGTSFVQGGEPVAELIGQRLPATLLLVLSALVLSSVGGLVLGVVAAWRPNGAFDLGVSGAALLGNAVPGFWLAQLALLVFAFRAGWFPVQGMTDARAEYVGMAAVLDVAHHLVLPALVLATSQLALVTRLTRTGLLGELGNEYVRTAQGKGLSRARTITEHALPNALLPVVTVVGSRLGLLFAITVVTETVFGWPGLGTLLLNASQTRDRPVLLGLVLFLSLSVIVANLLTDLIYAWIDPRLRQS